MAETIQIAPNVVASTIGNYMFGFDANTVINEHTGEITNGIHIVVPPGTDIITPERKAIIEEYRAQQQANRVSKARNDGLGRFVFCRVNGPYKGLRPETLARLVYLSTYTLHDDNVLYGGRKPIKTKSQLQRLLHIGRTATYDFWDDAHGKGFITDDGGVIALRGCNFVHGKLTAKGIAYTKVYIEQIRDLYTRCNSEQHRVLGYVFFLLPWLNTEYNMLCADGFQREKNPDNIVPLTLRECLSLLGLDPSNAERTRRKMQSLTLTVDGASQPVFVFIEKADTCRIFINPRLIYSGSDFRKVEIL